MVSQLRDECIHARVRYIKEGRGAVELLESFHSVVSSTKGEDAIARMIAEAKVSCVQHCMLRTADNS